MKNLFLLLSLLPISSSNSTKKVDKTHLLMGFSAFYSYNEFESNRTCDSDPDALAEYTPDMNRYKKIHNLYPYFVKDTIKEHEMDICIHIENFDEYGRKINTVCMANQGFFFFPLENKYMRNDTLYNYLSNEYCK